MPLFVYIYSQFGTVEPQILHVETLDGAGLPTGRKVLQKHKINVGMLEYSINELMSRFPFNPNNLLKETDDA